MPIYLRVRTGYTSHLAVLLRLLTTMTIPIPRCIPTQMMAYQRLGHELCHVVAEYNPVYKIDHRPYNGFQTATPKS